MALTLLGIHLSGVKVYEQGEELAADKKPVATFLVNLSYKRRVFEVLLDVVLMGVAYYGAHLLCFGPLGDEARDLLMHTLPVLVFIKMSAFLTVGVYRGLWRYIGINDLMVYAKAVGLGSLTCVLAFLMLYRFENLSRVVFILDGLLLFVMVAGSRMAFRLFRNMFPVAPKAGGRRVLIYGAGDAGVLLLREMHNNPHLECLPIGFADDNPHKAGKTINGLPVFGGNGSFTNICKQQRIDDVYISSLHFADERVREIQEQCRLSGIRLKRLRISFETLHEDEDLQPQAGIV